MHVVPFQRHTHSVSLCHAHTHSPRPHTAASIGSVKGLFIAAWLQLSRVVCESTLTAAECFAALSLQLLWFSLRLRSVIFSLLPLHSPRFTPLLPSSLQLLSHHWFLTYPLCCSINPSMWIYLLSPTWRKKKQQQQYWSVCVWPWWCLLLSTVHLLIYMVSDSNDSHHLS